MDTQQAVGRTAAIALVIGGVVIFLGSFQTWGGCPQEPCGEGGGLLHIFERSGIDFGPGVVTALLGIVIALIGLGALRQRRSIAALGLATVLASIALVIVGWWLLPAGERSPWAGIGVYIVAAGSVVALVASLRLRGGIGFGRSTAPPT